MSSQEIKENQIQITKLNLNKVFTLEFDYRMTYNKKEEEDDGIYYPQIPYENVNKHLMKIQEKESPMSKLEIIYQSCTFEITKEVELFWK